MKLRIKDNSIRLRLMKTEVAKLSETGMIESTIQFAHQKLTYKIGVSSDATMTATFDQNKITVFVPKEMLKNWAETEKVSLENTAADLKILIEKDFACLTERVGEDESDAYPNPNLSC